MPIVPRRSRVPTAQMPNVRVSSVADAEAFGAGPSAQALNTATQETLYTATKLNALAKRQDVLAAKEQEKREAAAAKLQAKTEAAMVKERLKAETQTLKELERERKAQEKLQTSERLKVEATTMKDLEKAARFALKEKEKADQLIVTEADTRASQLQTQIEIDTKRLSGRTAAGGPDQALEVWTKGTEEIKQGLTEQQKALFQQKQSVRWQRINKSVQMHLDGQMRKYDKDTTTTAVRSFRNEAIENPRDVERITHSLDQQYQVLAEYAQRNGHTEEWLSQRLQDETSKTHAAVIDRLMAENDMVGAQTYLEDHQDALDDKAKHAVEKGLIKQEKIAKVKATGEQFNGRVNLLERLATGEIDLTATTVPKIAAIDPDFGAALNRVLDDGGMYLADGKDDAQFSSIAQKVFAQNDIPSLNAFLVNSLKTSTKGNTNKSRLRILAALAKEHATTLQPQVPDAIQAPITEDTYKTGKMHQALQNGMEFINKSTPSGAGRAVAQFLQRRFSSSPQKPEQIIALSKQVAVETVRADYPAIRSLPKVPNHIISGDDPVETIYNGSDDDQEDGDEEDE